MGTILTDDNYSIQAYPPGARHALLINPPVYDAQYWARWSQPAGLLRIATIIKKKGDDIIFKGEIREASQLPTDLSLYSKSPSYAILATSRGCPWDCVYCAARTLNGGAKVRTRTTQDILEEIRYKYEHFGIRRFGFY